MTVEGRGLRDALAEAQALGYAEADPTADVEGFDAAAKVQILASLAFGTALDGASDLPRGDHRACARWTSSSRGAPGYVIKLLGGRRAGRRRRACRGGSTPPWSPSRTPWPRCTAP